MIPAKPNAVVPPEKQIADKINCMSDAAARIPITAPKYRMSAHIPITACMVFLPFYGCGYRMIESRIVDYPPYRPGVNHGNPP